MTTVTHLTSSTFHGGPERQMLGLAGVLAADVRSIFLSFSEGGQCRAFLDEARRQGFQSHELGHDTPHFRRACGELAEYLRRHRCDILLCHGYKAGLIGRIAARRAKIPVVAVSRGWTYESAKVRLYELLDRINLRWMDRVVCVSQGQAAKVRKAGVGQRKIVVIPNAIDTARFATAHPAARSELEALFPRPVRRIVGAAGRLSPEKGFKDLVEAAALVAKSDQDVGFVVFGDGVLRPVLEEQIAAWGLNDRFVLVGFRRNLDDFLPHLDLLVQSSLTEGMPNVVLEASAAGIPVVATCVGGTPEIIVEGCNGYLVPPGDPARLARRILKVVEDQQRGRMGDAGRVFMQERFTFQAQGHRYLALFEELALGGPAEHMAERTGNSRTAL
jgi:glycosyltransferase involved in cell wall biosynthesis